MNQERSVLAKIPDKQVRHGRLIDVIDHLTRLQVQRIGIEVEQR